MGFYIDFSELEKYARDMKVAERDFNSFLRDLLLRLANEVLRETIPNTPKDTGALRGAWSLGEISGSGKDISVVIENPMEYATDIEYGHRIVVGSGPNKTEVGWYEGRFMLKTSIDNVRSKMPSVYEEKLREFCKNHGIG